MAPRKKPQTAQLSLREQLNWGERVHLAYRQARDHYGAAFNYRTRAAAISQAYPVRDNQLVQLEKYDEIPSRPLTRLRAYLALLSYGYDPAEFGLTPDNVPLHGFDMKKVSDLLNPSFMEVVTVEHASFSSMLLTHQHAG